MVLTRMEKAAENQLLPHFLMSVACMCMRHPHATTPYFNEKDSSTWKFLRGRWTEQRLFKIITDYKSNPTQRLPAFPACDRMKSLKRPRYMRCHTCFKLQRFQDNQVRKSSFPPSSCVLVQKKISWGLRQWFLTAFFPCGKPEPKHVVPR